MGTTSKWVVFNQNGKRVRTVTLRHPDGALYKQMEPFEKKLLKEGLSAHKAEALEQEFLKGKTFKEKLICLGWEFPIPRTVVPESTKAMDVLKHLQKTELRLDKQKYLHRRFTKGELVLLMLEIDDINYYNKLAGV